MIFLDSWIFIEFFAEGGKKKEVESILSEVKKGSKAIISTLVLTEVKYRIGKKFSPEIGSEVVYFIENFPNIKIVPIVSGIAKLAADLRLKYYSKKRKLSFIDTINLATALVSKCEEFYSGDPDFEDIEEIKIKII